MFPSTDVARRLAEAEASRLLRPHASGPESNGALSQHPLQRRDFNPRGEPINTPAAQNGRVFKRRGWGEAAARARSPCLVFRQTKTNVRREICASDSSCRVAVAARLHGRFTAPLKRADRSSDPFGSAVVPAEPFPPVRSPDRAAATHSVLGWSSSIVEG